MAVRPLSNRSQRLLAALVREYIATGEVPPEITENFVSGLLTMQTLFGHPP